MKKLLILILGAALATGAWLSRPQDPKKSFANYLVREQGHAQPAANVYAGLCTYQDHFFWIDVKEGDKPICTNVFHQWFNLAEIKSTVQSVESHVH